MGTNKLAASVQSAMARSKSFFARASSAYHSWRGRRYGEKGEHDKAIADFTEAIRLDPTVADTCSGRGWCYAWTGADDKAIADFTEAIRLDPTVADTYSGRGRCYAWTGADDKAIADF